MRRLGLTSSLLAELAVVLAATAAWAVPADPVPVKHSAHVSEGAPTSQGVWLGWRQSLRGDPTHHNFLVQRGKALPIRVNAARTEGLSGGIAGHHVYYVQLLGDDDPWIMDFDLVKRTRSPLPAKVNEYHHRVDTMCCGHHMARAVSGVRGDVTASGPWVLYSGSTVFDRDYLDHETVMLYNRVTHHLRTLYERYDDEGVMWAGQVNGRYATYWWYGRYGGEDLYRYDIRTKRTVELPLPDESVWDPGVSSDGTVYYVHHPGAYPEDGPDTFELVRHRVGEAPEVVTTLTNETRRLGAPQEIYVRDRANGSHVVFLTWHDDVYKIVD